MPTRIDKSWLVLDSIENAEHDRCVDLFRRSVAQSGDLLFTRVLESTAAFLPMLLYPKVYETARAEQCWGGPLPHPDWRPVLEKVIDFGCAHGWNDAGKDEVAHV